jgi:glucose-6-phosphate dehydrogenase assembly protein OpcA
MSDGLQGPADVAFTEVESVLADRRNEGRGGATPPRALTATIVAVGADDQVAEAARPLQQLAEAGGVRAIGISHGSSPETRARISASFVSLVGVPPAYVDNAVAAIRLSSLPTIVWWRGGSLEVLDCVVELADRIVLDVDPPDDVWAHAVTILDRTAFSDLRWTRLTRWRALMAQFFDIPGIAAASPAFSRLHIEGGDRPTVRLFAAWLKTSLKWDDSVTVEIGDSGREAPIEVVNLGGGGVELQLCLAGSRRCVETSARVPGQPTTFRVVSLGSQQLERLLAEELRIRSRDAAFEQAVRACVSS